MTLANILKGFFAIYKQQKPPDLSTRWLVYKIFATSYLARNDPNKKINA